MRDLRLKSGLVIFRVWRILSENRESIGGIGKMRKKWEDKKTAVKENGKVLLLFLSEKIVLKKHIKNTAINYESDRRKKGQALFSFTKGA